MKTQDDVCFSAKTGGKHVGYIEGADRGQMTLFPDRLEDWVGEDNPVRVIDLFVDEINLAELGFVRTAPAQTGRPGYRPSVLLKLFIYGYLNRVPSSRALEREAGRNVEVMWLTGRLAPDHKTIADFRRDNGPAIRRTCAQFVELCRRIWGVKGGLCRHRRLKVQGGQQSRQELHQRQDQKPHGPSGREYSALP